MPEKADPRWPFFTCDIELTNFCAQNCLFCPRDAISRPFGYMPLPLLEQIVPQLAEIGSRITFCGMGNPLLHPEFAGVMNYCRSIPGLNFGVTIQAPALNEENCRILQQTRPGFIEVSFATIDEKLFGEIYPGCLLQDSLANLSRLSACQPPLRGIRVIAVKTGAEKYSESEIKAFWNEKGLACRINACHSRGGNLKNRQMATTESKPRRQCGLFASHAFITWQGRLLACCHDLTGVSEIADLAQSSILAAGEKKQQLLASGMPFTICGQCDEPAAGRKIPDQSFPSSSRARRKFLQKIESDQ